MIAKAENYRERHSRVNIFKEDNYEVYEKA